MKETPLKHGWTLVSKSREEYQALSDEDRKALGWLCWAYTKHLCKPFYPSRDGSLAWTSHLPHRPNASTEGGSWSAVVRNEDLSRFIAADTDYFEGTQK